MTGVAVVTDASTDLPRALTDALGVVVAPVGYEVGGRHLRSDQQSAADFYRDLAVAATAQVSGVASDHFEEAFRAAAKRSKDIICVCQSFASSFTRVSAEVAARDATANGATVRIINPGRATAGLAAVVIAGARASAGASMADAVSIFERLSTVADNLVIAHDLDQLDRSGQLQLLNSQSSHGPLDAGVPLFRVRGALTVQAVVPDVAAAESALLDRAAQLANGRPVVAVVTHALAPVAAARLAAALQARLKVAELITTEMGPTVGSVLGAGAYGVGLCLAQPPVA